MMKISAVTCLALAALFSAGCAHKTYRDRIPNGDRVPDPCQPGAVWPGVGHRSPAGGHARNPFGLDFKAAGFTWSADLCRRDSDGDGLTNGQELGDPDCVWQPGGAPARTTGLSHPGICPLDSATCVNAWTVCPNSFSCPGMSEPGVTVRNFTLRSTPVPTNYTTYICQAFELNSTAAPVHMIGSRPVVDNKEVLHHVIMYVCNVRPSQELFDSPQECFMTTDNCTEMLSAWTYGLEGECLNGEAGFLIGGAGYRYGLLQLHWSNPELHSGYRDASGLSLYFTSNLKKYNLGILVYGEQNLVLPPRQPMVSVSHSCPAACTGAFHEGTRYITGIKVHMHKTGIRGRVSLWRNGSLVRDILPLQVCDYNSPRIVLFDRPIEYLRGDEVKTECYYSTLASNYSILAGTSSRDEMCLSFLTYYPNDLSVSPDDKLSACLALAGINDCWMRSGVTPQIEQGCNVTGMQNGDIPKEVLAQMTNSSCFSTTGCVPSCRDYLTGSLWPGNACYDPNRARQMAEVLAFGIFPIGEDIATLISTTLYGQRYCEQEVAMLANLFNGGQIPAAMTATMPIESGLNAVAASSNGYLGLTSQQLFVIILTGICLGGCVLILAVLGLIASRLHPNRRCIRLTPHGSP